MSSQTVAERITRFWTAKDDALVLDPNVSAAQAAHRLDRTRTAVYARRQVLRGTSSRPRWRTQGFPQAPRGHPDWVIAKTCVRCERFLMISAYSRRQSGEAQSYCRQCQSDYVGDRMREDETFRQRFTDITKQSRDARQAETVSTATNARKVWTGPELELLGRDDLSHAQMARMLGRSLYAVRHKLRKLNAGDPKVTRLAGWSKDA